MNLETQIAEIRSQLECTLDRIVLLPLPRYKRVLVGDARRLRAAALLAEALGKLEDLSKALGLILPPGPTRHPTPDTRHSRRATNP